MKIKIKNFNGELPNYLTVSKIYDVIVRSGNFFDIYADNGNRIMVRVTGCVLINGGSWEVVKLA